jgi:hypothetical protein
VPPAAPNEFAVHELHVVLRLKPVLCVFSGHIVHWSLRYTYPGWHTHVEAFPLPVFSVVNVSGHAEQLWSPAYCL